MSATESTFTTSLHTFGCIGAVSRFTVAGRLHEKAYSLEDFVGRITALFSPYLQRTITEHDFSVLQKELRAMLTELKRQGGDA